MADVKYAVYEIDGVDINDPGGEERLLHAMDTTFDNANYPTEATKVQAVLESLLAAKGKPNVYEASSEPVDSSTANGWVPKLTYTLVGAPAGIYLYQWSAEVTNSNRNKVTGFRSLIQGVIVAENDDGVGVSNQYSPRSGFFVYVHGGGDITVDLEYGFTIGGGTARIRSARVKLVPITVLS